MTSWTWGCWPQFLSSVWILVLLLGAGAPLACPGLRYLKYRQTRLVADISTVLSYNARIRPVFRVGTAPVGVPVTGCLLATVRGAMTPIVGAAVPNTNSSERKCPNARKKVQSVM